MKKEIIAGIAIVLSTTNLLAQNPGGVKSPCTWFKTTAVNDNLNGSYRWVDYSGDSTRLFMFGTTTEVISQREDIHTYNFNPALPFDSTANKEFTVKGTLLPQRTIIGVVGSKKEESNKESYIYNINGQKRKGRILSKTRVLHTTSEGKTAYDYTPNLKSSNDTAKRVKIVSYMEALQPEYSVWNNSQSSKVNFGGKFSASLVSDDSEYSENDLSSLTSSDFYSPELIVYPRYLRDNERLRVESYLALKYGITLDGDYYSASGKKIWSDASYHNRVTGYGRDIRSSFNQLQSTTAYEENAYDVDDTYYLGDSYNLSSSYNLIVMGFMENTSIPDSCYVLFADNGKETSILTENNTSDSIYSSDSLKLMQRKWKVLSYNIDSTYSHQLELGYNMTKDSTFAYYRNENIYMIIERKSGKIDTIRMSGVDEEREKVIFTDFRLDSLDFFTFGFSGVPLEKPKEEKYDYFLELSDPTCDGYQSNNDGMVKLFLPENEQGFYYSFGIANQYAGSNGPAFDSLLINNISPIDYDGAVYKLKIIPAGSKSIDFTGTGISLVNLHFINEGGSVEWSVADSKTESKVAFVQDNTYNTTDNVFYAGIKIANGNYYLIDRYQINQNPDGTVSDGDKFMIKRMGGQIKIYKNNVLICQMQILPGNYKLAVKHDDENVKSFLFSEFNWNSSMDEYPTFMFDPYRYPFTHSSSDIVAGPTGYMEYIIDFNIKCYDHSYKDGQQGLSISTDMKNHKFTAVVTVKQPCTVDFYVYDANGTLYNHETSQVYQNQVSKTFTENVPGVYFVKAVTSYGEVFDGKTEVK